MVAAVFDGSNIQIFGPTGAMAVVLAARGTSTPKGRHGYVEALRVLQTARTGALKARTAVLAPGTVPVPASSGRRPGTGSPAEQPQK